MGRTCELTGQGVLRWLRSVGAGFGRLELRERAVFRQQGPRDPGEQMDVAHAEEDHTRDWPRPH